MDQITVPQFIENEDKILGPITVRQFGILFIGGVLIFIAYKLFDFALFVFVALLILIVSGTLAFFKVNGRPVHYFLFNIGETMQRPSLRVWRRDVDRSTIAAVKAEQNEYIKLIKEEKDDYAEGTLARKPRASEQRLSEVALIVDTGGAYRPEHEDTTELF